MVVLDIIVSWNSCEYDENDARWMGLPLYRLANKPLVPIAGEITKER